MTTSTIGTLTGKRPTRPSVVTCGVPSSTSATSVLVPPPSSVSTRPKPAADSQPKRLSALDAAAQVLAKAKEPMGAKDLIEAMAQQNLWTSPGGQTPSATLYAAMIREIATKGDAARFKRVDRGQFTANR